MGKGSQQSKRKQQTLKKESQDHKTSGRRLSLTMEQASIFKQLIQATNEAQAQLNFALTTAGISGEQVVGGDLDSDTPYLEFSPLPKIQ